MLLNYYTERINVRQKAKKERDVKVKATERNENCCASKRNVLTEIQ